MLAKLLTAAAVASLATSPVIASPASSLSLSKARVATKGEKKSEVVGGAVLIGILATVAVIGGAVVLSRSDSTPDSP